MERRTRPGYSAVWAVTLVLGCSSWSNGQAPEPGIGSPFDPIGTPSLRLEALTPTVDRLLLYRGLSFEPRPASRVVTRDPMGMNRQQVPAARAGRSAKRKLFGAIVGGVGGMIGGILIGSRIESGEWTNGESVIGPLVGAPVGGVTGGIIGYKFLF